MRRPTATEVTRPPHADAPAAAPRRRGLLRRFRRSEEGSLSVEYAFVIIPLLTMLLGTMEVGIGYFADRTLNAGVDEVSRQIRTGQVRPGAMDHTQFKQLLCDQPVMVLFDCAGLYVSVQQTADFRRPPPPPSRDANGNVVFAPVFAPGGRLSINVVRVYYEWPTMVNFAQFGIDGRNNAVGRMGGTNNRLLRATTAFMNEPY